MKKILLFLMFGLLLVSFSSADTRNIGQQTDCSNDVADYVMLDTTFRSITSNTDIAFTQVSDGPVTFFVENLMMNDTTSSWPKFVAENSVTFKDAGWFPYFSVNWKTDGATAVDSGMVAQTHEYFNFTWTCYNSNSTCYGYIDNSTAQTAIINWNADSGWSDPNRFTFLSSAGRVLNLTGLIVWEGEITCPTEAPPDTCTYTSGDWNGLGSDNCDISSPVTMDAGSKLSLSGGGGWTVQADINGMAEIEVQGSSLEIYGAGLGVNS